MTFNEQNIAWENSCEHRRSWEQEQEDYEELLREREDDE